MCAENAQWSAREDAQLLKVVSAAMKAQGVKAKPRQLPCPICERRGSAGGADSGLVEYDQQYCNNDDCDNPPVPTTHRCHACGLDFCAACRRPAFQSGPPPSPLGSWAAWCGVTA